MKIRCSTWKYERNSQVYNMDCHFVEHNFTCAKMTHQLAFSIRFRNLLRTQFQMRFNCVIAFSVVGIYHFIIVIRFWWHFDNGQKNSISIIWFQIQLHSKLFCKSIFRNRQKKTHTHTRNSTLKSKRIELIFLDILTNYECWRYNDRLRHTE